MQVLERQVNGTNDKIVRVSRDGERALKEAQVRAPTTWEYPPTRLPESPRIVVQCAPRASNGPNHLGLCALQDRLNSKQKERVMLEKTKASNQARLDQNDALSREMRENVRTRAHLLLPVLSALLACVCMLLRILHAQP